MPSELFDESDPLPSPSSGTSPNEDADAKLRPVRHGDPAAVRTADGLERAFRWCQRHPARFVLAVIATALLVGGGVVSLRSLMASKTERILKCRSFDLPSRSRDISWAGQLLVDTSGERLDILANGFGSLISPDGSLIAAKQGTVHSAAFIGRVNTRSIELKRMPTGDVLRPIEAHPGWDEDEVAFDPLAFSQDQQKFIYMDYTDKACFRVPCRNRTDLTGLEVLTCCFMIDSVWESIVA